MVSVVPVGLSKYRDGLYPLEPFTKEDACEVIDLIEKWQKINYERHGIHLSMQAMNGISWRSGDAGGRDAATDISSWKMASECACFRKEVMDALDEKTDDGKKEELSIATDTCCTRIWKSL